MPLRFRASLESTMQDLAEKVQTLEKRLDELGNVFDTIRKSLTRERECGKQCRSVAKTVQSETVLGQGDCQVLGRNFNRIKDCQGGA